MKFVGLKAPPRFARVRPTLFFSPFWVLRGGWGWGCFPFLATLACFVLSPFLPAPFFSLQGHSGLLIGCSWRSHAPPRGFTDPLSHMWAPFGDCVRHGRNSGIARGRGFCPAAFRGFLAPCAHEGVRVDFVRGVAGQS